MKLWIKTSVYFLLSPIFHWAQDASTRYRDRRHCATYAKQRTHLTHLFPLCLSVTVFLSSKPPAAVGDAQAWKYKSLANALLCSLFISLTGYRRRYHNIPVSRWTTTRSISQRASSYATPAVWNSLFKCCLIQTRTFKRRCCSQHSLTNFNFSLLLFLILPLAYQLKKV